MAKVSSDGLYVITEKDDTLWSIARTHLEDATKYKQLATINNIPNPDKISIGQKIYLSKNGAPASSSSTTKATINHFGLQSDVDNTLLATWTWSRDKTEHYEVVWQYYTKDKVWFVGEETTTKYRYHTYSIPSNATQIRFRVKPISKKKKQGDKEVSEWTASWTDWKQFSGNAIPPEAPPAPTVTIDGYKLTAVLDNLDVNASYIEFQIVRNNVTIVSTKQCPIRTSHSEYTYTVAAGYEYKVRCRAVRGSPLVESEWSDYSSNVGTAPSASTGIKTIKALSATSVQITWEKVTNAKSYDIQYTTDKMYFDSSSEVQSTSVESIVNHAEITGLESGKEYFFRVRAVNDKGESAWTAIKSIIIGKTPAAPTTWSSTTSAVSGEDLTLYWVHNSEDGSIQKYAELSLNIKKDSVSHAIPATISFDKPGIWSYDVATGSKALVKEFKDEEDEGRTNACIIKTTNLNEGTSIAWKVRTAGITNTYGGWSTSRRIDIYLPLTLELEILDKDLKSITGMGVRSFPFYIYGLAGPKTQRPVGYHLNIVADGGYDTTDDLGNSMHVSPGDSVYSKYFDTSDELMVEMSAGNVNLEKWMRYTIICTVSATSGLTTETSLKFTVYWDDVEYVPNAEVGFDEKSYSAVIRPYCGKIETTYREVFYDSKTDVFRVTNTTIDTVYSTDVDPIADLSDTELEALGFTDVEIQALRASQEHIKKSKDRKTDTGQQVYSGVDDDGNDIYYCIDTTSDLIQGVTLSVYRREFDGSFTEIATGLNNTDSTFVLDPHPALDYARYRIVATTVSTGAITYYDIPNYPIGGTAVIIQWNEDWSTFNSFGNPDELVEQPWSGSLLKLPYNIKVSDKNSKDVSLIKYIGRKRPVSYYGTQLGETASWSVDIDKNDEETLYALRRLSVWQGDVYVREPSGSGYWANIVVSFSQSYNELTIPVSLEITRVEGGV